MTTSNTNIIYLKNGTFYLKDKQGLKEIDTEDLEHIDYQLLINDSYFFYESIEMPTTNKKKQLAIIKNFLLVSYPEELISHFNYINIKQQVIIYIMTEKLIQLIENNKKIFLNSNKISTPFIESLIIYNNFNYKIGKLLYQIVNSQVIHISETDGEIKSADNIIEKIDELNGNLIIIKKDTTLPHIIKSMKIPAAMLLAAYIIFIAGHILRINALKEYLERHENLLNEIYESAGVMNSQDPYNTLMAKTRNSANLDNRSILLDMQQISMAMDNQTIIDTLNIRRDSIRFDGITKDYSSLESFTNKLREYFQKNIIILNTKKEEDHISFSLRIG